VLELIRPDALDNYCHGAVLVEPPLVELLELGDVLLEPILPLDVAGSVAEFVAELSAPLTGPEGEVIPLLLSVAALPLGFAMLLGFVALFGVMLLLELPAVVPLAPASWANAAGANAATDNARPTPSK
jgi:hypothetical protein